MKFHKRYVDTDVRMVHDGSDLYYSIHDVAQALKFNNPRREVIEVVTRIEKDETVSQGMRMVDWYGGELCVVTNGILLDLILRAERRMQRNFLVWLLDTNRQVTRKCSGAYNNSDGISPYLYKNDDYYATSQIAKMYGISAITLNNILVGQSVHYKVNDQWVLYADYQDKDLVTTKMFKKDGKEYLHTYWTKKGLEFVEDILKRLNYRKQGEQLKLDLKV